MESQIPGRPGQPGPPSPGPNQPPPQIFSPMPGQPGFPPRPTSFSQFKSRFGIGQISSGFGFSQSGYGQMPLSPMSSQGVRQYTLESMQGFPGSGIATISGELQLMVVASLPPPASFVNTPSAIYVAYLVDKKGQQGFAAGKLTPSRDGVSHLSFLSPVPLSNYTRVVISIEDPHKIQAYPQGPIVLKVKDDFRTRLTQGDFTKGAFAQAKKAGSFVQGKVGGFFRSRFGKPSIPAIPDITSTNPATTQESGIAGVGAGIPAAGIPSPGPLAHQPAPNMGASQAHMSPNPQTPLAESAPQMAYPNPQSPYPTVNFEPEHNPGESPKHP